jgi:ubiquitin carboxyl-terminal hydrolase 7
LMVPKNAQVADLLVALQKKANISDEVMPKIRAYEAHVNKFHKILPPDHSVMSLYDYTSIFVAPFPEDESSKKISVFHFDKEPSKAHGVPFQFALKEGEPFSETKQRLSDFTKIKGKQLDKIRFALVGKAQYSKPEPIDDDEVLWDTVGARDDISLGLEHPAKTKTLWGKTDSIFIR